MLTKLLLTQIFIEPKFFLRSKFFRTKFFFKLSLFGEYFFVPKLFVKPPTQPHHNRWVTRENDFAPPPPPTTHTNPMLATSQMLLTLIDQNLKASYWEHLEQIPIVTVTFI